MHKLIAAFAADRNVKTAQRLVSYLRAHMMAECMADPEDHKVIAAARALLSA